MTKTRGFVQAVAGFTVMSMLIAGCSTNNNGKENANSTDSNASANTSTSTSSSKSGDKIKLTYWVVENEINEKVKEYMLVNEFKKVRPDVEIELVPGGGSTTDYNPRVHMAAGTDTLPDMFNQTFMGSGSYIDAGVVTNLTDYFNQKEGFMELFREGAFEGVKRFAKDGGIYAMPTQAEAQGWFYNKALFDKYNLKIPTQWDELMEAVKTFRANGITPISHGAADIFAIWGYNPFFFRYGLDEELAKLNSGELSFNDSYAFTRSFERVQELVEAGAFPENVATVNATQAKESFLAGQTAMWQAGSWELDSIAKSAIADDVEFNWGPAFPDGVGEQKRGYKQFGWAIYVGSAAGKDPAKMDAIIDFMKFRASPEMTSKLFNEFGHISATIMNDEDLSKLPPIYVKVFGAFDDPSVVPSMEVPAVFDDSFKIPFRNAFAGVVTGVTTPKEATQQVQDWYNIQMK